MFPRQVGHIVISRIVESERADALLDPIAVFPETKPENWEPHKTWMQPRAMDPTSGQLIFSIQSYLLHTSHHTILVDTCVGDNKQRQYPGWNMTTSGIFLERLARAGVRPEAVDYVICTHMHADHVGWNTTMSSGRWVPTFPKATYIFSQKEYDHWQTLSQSQPNQTFTDSILPVVDAGLAVFVTNDHALHDEVWIESTPGHTPGHLSVHLASNGAKAIIAADLMHSPIQCVEPAWNTYADFDRELARKTRRAFLESYCDTDVLIGVTHFPSPSMGHITSRGDSFWFLFDHSAD